MKEKEFAVIMCPPLSGYSEKPASISKSEIIDCPTCNEKMWFSEKKKLWKEISEGNGREIIFECYDCLLKRAKEDPDLFKNIMRIDI